MLELTQVVLDRPEEPRGHTSRVGRVVGRRRVDTSTEVEEGGVRRVSRTGVFLENQ